MHINMERKFFMKHYLNRMEAMLLALVIAFSLVACGGGNTAEPIQNPGDAAASVEETKTLTGKLDEIKDFMFVVEADDGNPYAFPYDSANKPEGLEDVAVGDSVVITYSGELSVVDNFTGQIISIEKAEEP